MGLVRNNEEREKKNSLLSSTKHWVENFVKPKTATAHTSETPHCRVLRVMDAWQFSDG